MRIAINTRLLIRDKLDGIGWFTFHTVKRMAENHPEVEFVLIFDRPWDHSFIFSENITAVRTGPMARHPFLYYLWFERSIPKILNKFGPDLLINPDGFACLSTSIPQLCVIHDLNFEHYPEYLPFFYRRYYRRYFRKFAEKAERIATVSEYSKSDISSRYDIEPDKIDVVYNGVNEIFSPLSDDRVTEVRNRFTEGRGFFLFTGSLHPRKNPVTLFKAFDKFRKSSGMDHKLVIVGERKWWDRETMSAFSNMKFRKDVIFTGHLPVDQLAEITSSASCMIYISRFEGFGVPIIEAMRSGIPVITSGVTSMPEVAGGAALLVDPNDPETVSNAMIEICSEEDRRNEMINKGIRVSENYSWDRTAELLWGSAMNALNTQSSSNMS